MNYCGETRDESAGIFTSLVIIEAAVYNTCKDLLPESSRVRYENHMAYLIQIIKKYEVLQ